MIVAAHVLVWILVIVQGLVIVALVREVSELKAYWPAHTLRPVRGTKAPDFVAADLHSDIRTSLRDLEGSPVVLCFLSCTCPDCWRLGDELAQESPAILSNLILLCHGDRSEVARRFEVASRRIRTLYSLDYGVYVATGVPIAFLLDHEGVISSVIEPTTAKDLRLALTNLVRSAGTLLQTA